MKTSVYCPWMRLAHAYLREAEAKWGEPFGMTYEELCAQLGEPPFDDEAARSLLARTASLGYLRGVRERAPVTRKSGSNVRVRYYPVGEIPADPKKRVRQESYFDGLVRATSVFDLARVMGLTNTSKEAAR